MQKYKEMLKYELKNIFRDKMTLTILLMPVAILLLAAFLIPKILNSTDSNSAQAMVGSIIAFITLISMGTFLIASLLAFVLLDRKDEKTLNTIAATPLSVSGYIKFQAVYNYILTIIMNLILLIGLKLFANDSYSFIANGSTFYLFGDLTYDKIIVFSIVSGLYMPALGLLLSGLANNKIEGFAYVKMSGFLIVIPILIVLQSFSGGLQYVLGIAPNFWAIKGLLVTVMPSNSSDMNFWLYMLIGAVYGLSINIPAYKFFIKRAMRS